MEILILFYPIDLVSDEFNPDEEMSADDEETIAQEEANASADHAEEIAALQMESTTELENLGFLKGYLQNRDKIQISESEDESVSWLYDLKRQIVSILNFFLG